MKFKLTTVILFLLLSSGVQAAGKYAYIDANSLLEQTPQSNAALETLKNEFKGRDTSLRGMLDEINTMEKNYKNDSAIMSDDQKKKVEEQIIQSKRQFQFDQKSLREDLQKRQTQLLNEVKISVSKVIQEYGAKNGYDFIFTDGVAYASDSVNITADILKELQK